MRKLIFILLCLPFGSLAQIPDSVQVVLNNFTLADRSISYSKVYEADGKTAAEIKDLLISAFSGVPKITINENSISEIQVVGNFSNHIIDFRKYGGTWWGTPVWNLSPIGAKFTFQIKDNKYRLVVTDIESGGSPYPRYNTREKKVWAIDKKAGYMGYYYFGKSVEDLFDITKYTAKNNW